ncbi:MAG TPA: DUF711 family protein [Candidatus Sulfotelmatobacter sp.]|jgi:uncharacterized protein (UPF0210 family)|nr:DUF711 family protein [Candidatus Sulfotelmatobacter sp.]
MKNYAKFFAPFLLALFGLTPAAFSQTQTPPKAPANAKPHVRTITAFVTLDRSQYQLQFAETAKFLGYAKTVFESRGYTVETLRIVTQPFPDYTKDLSTDDAIRFFKNLDGLADQHHVRLSIGSAYLSGNDGDAQADLLAAVLQNTKNIFGNLAITKDSGINWPAVNAAARLIKKLSETTEHSEGNFHFAANASVPPYSPFFPGAYHTGAGHQFAIGLASAGLLTTAAQNAPDLAAAKRQIVDAFYNAAFDVEDAALRIDREQGWIYMGLDLSPASSQGASIGAAIEAISRQPLGSSGTMTAVGVITSALKDIGARRTGYSGVMLPVLEDPTLADRWNQGRLSLDQLLSYSAVCATGLDTIPLPGDTTVEELARIIGDVATLSVKWNKPLSARLLPVKEKHAGEMTEFTDPFLINGLIRPVPGKEQVQ